MAGLYLHIPFCKQACHYCDFHFSTSLKKKSDLVAALCTEMVLRKHELEGPVKTIYFGGGTPSLLSANELETIFDTIFKHYEVTDDAEITLEANPDDLSESKIREFSVSPINRLSIGVQSFFEEDLRLMNRAHSSEEAFQCIQIAREHFENISIDLIYGIPGMSEERWLENVSKALKLGIPHLSCYALTVEPKTALNRFIEKGIVPPVEDEVARRHHTLLMEATQNEGMVNYEFSNFGKPGFESQNNLGYWMGESYLGIGPSAHSYDGSSRSWNIANNSRYIKAIEAGKLPLEREQLTLKDRFNEYVMTRLRTQRGMLKEEVETQFGPIFWRHVEAQAERHILSGLMVKEGGFLRITNAGKFLGDGIASDLFLVHLRENT